MTKLRNWIKIVKMRLLICLAFLSIPGIVCPEIPRIENSAAKMRSAFHIPETYDDLVMLLLGAMHEEFYIMNSDEENESLAEFFITLAKIGALVVDGDRSSLLDFESNNLLALYRNSGTSKYESNFDIVQCKSFVKKCKEAYKATKDFVEDHVPQIIVGGLSAIALLSGAVSNANAKSSPDYQRRNPCQNPDHHRSPYNEPSIFPKRDSFEPLAKGYKGHNKAPKSISPQKGRGLENAIENAIQENPCITDQINEELKELQNYLSALSSVEDLVDPVISEEVREKGSYVSHRILESYLDLAFDEGGLDALDNRGSSDLDPIEKMGTAYLEGHEEIDRFFDTKDSAQFIYGVAKGLPRGAYESGKEIVSFLGNLATHPIKTSAEMYHALSTLARLANHDEWGMIAKALSPEIFQLVNDWNTLSVQQKGELAGFALGKHGVDFFAPNVMTKLASKGCKNGRKLGVASKNLKKAEEVVALEAAKETRRIAKLGEANTATEKAAQLGKNLEIVEKEAEKLAKGSKLETVPTNNLEHLKLTVEESFKLYEVAEEKLKPFHGKYLGESEARELIHAAGLPTFPRPKGMPKDYKIKLSNKPGGIKYVHPHDEGTYVRIMPGKLHSANPLQQKPYVNQRIHGKSVDKHGNIVANKSPKAHIPLEEFVYIIVEKN